jgi:hypothetical protein
MPDRTDRDDKNECLEPDADALLVMQPHPGFFDSILDRDQSLFVSVSQAAHFRLYIQNRARKIRKRLADAFWREHWREGIERIAKSDFAKSGGQHGWRATLDWFLGGDSLAKILEG